MKKARKGVKREHLIRERQIRVKTLSDAGFSAAEIAKTLRISELTVKKILKEDNNNDQN